MGAGTGRAISTRGTDMDAYIFQAALICSDCAETHVTTHAEPDDAADNSDSWPAGPYGDGGGEADSPQHCDMCRVFLDNSLTGDGSTYVKGLWRDFVEIGRGDVAVLREWRDAYICEWTEFVDVTYQNMLDDGDVSDLEARRFADLEAN
jgi:hypothetical protein